MEKEIYEQLMCKIKVFEKNIVNLPRVGEQIQHHLIHIIDDAERFKLIINKRGHKNPDNLTIMLYSMNQNSTMIRFDVMEVIMPILQTLTEYLRHTSIS